MVQIRHHQRNEHFTRHYLAVLHCNVRFPIFVRFLLRSSPLHLTLISFPHILGRHLLHRCEREQRLYGLHKRFSVPLQIPTRHFATHRELAGDRRIGEHFDGLPRVFVANRRKKTAGRHEIHFRLGFRLHRTAS